MRVLLTLAMCCALAAAPYQTSAQDMSCLRACLESLADRYLMALIRRDASDLPLGQGVKFTENAQRLELGDGLWNTATGRGYYALIMADEAAGQVAWMGTLHEANVPTVFVLRLAVAGGLITEIETLVIRDRAVAERLDAIAEPRRAF